MSLGEPVLYSARSFPLSQKLISQNGCVPYIYIHIYLKKLFATVVTHIPGSSNMCKMIAVLSKLCLLTQRRLFSPAGSFQCLHTLASINIAKRRNLPSKRRNLPAKRRFLLPGSELDSRRALFLRKSVFSATGKKYCCFGKRR